MNAMKSTRFVPHVVAMMFCLLLCATLPIETFASCPTSSTCTAVRIYNYTASPYLISVEICNGTLGACMSRIFVPPASGSDPGAARRVAPTGYVISGVCAISPTPPNFYFDEANCIMYIF